MKPNERDPVAEQLFGGLEPPEPPRRLRGAVLAGARKRLQTGTHADVWSRIWNHPGFRLGWAAAVILLVLGHVLVVPIKGAIRSASIRELVAEQRADFEVLELVRPVRISEDVQPVVGLFAAASVSDDLETKGDNS